MMFLLLTSHKLSPRCEAAPTSAFVIDKSRRYTGEHSRQLQHTDATQHCCSLLARCQDEYKLELLPLQPVAGDADKITQRGLKNRARALPRGMAAAVDPISSSCVPFNVLSFSHHVAFLLRHAVCCDAQNGIALLLRAKN